MKEFKHISNNIYSKYVKPMVVNGGGMRQYKLGEETFPSITHILGQIDNEGIAAWRERVGAGEANRICTAAIKRGNRFHQICEAYLNNNLQYGKFNNHLLEFAMFEQARPSLERISDIVGIEMPMISRELVIGGTADIIAKFDGIDSIIDLKSSTKPKKESWCERFFLQETAYSLMFEEITSKPTEQLVTIIASENGTVQVLVRNRDDFAQELKQIISQYQSGRVQI